MPPSHRQARSPVVQFYSSINNLGNYTSVLGIQQMLGRETDTWCMYDRHVDFDFINSSYVCAIIGGAGLLNSCFEPFWEKVRRYCKIPLILWGVGVSFPDRERAAVVDRAIVSEVASRCGLINVRDDLTANYYRLKRTSITACPTIAFLKNYRTEVAANRVRVLFSHDEELVLSSETTEIQAILRQIAPTYRSTNHRQRRFVSLHHILLRSYCKSRVVIATCLHGAIIAYGLGIPYLAIPRDEKLRAFYRLYGNGNSLDKVADLGDILRWDDAQITQPIALEPVLEFGDRAKAWVDALCDASQQPGPVLQVS